MPHSAMLTSSATRMAPPDKGDEKIIILRILIESRPHQQPHQHCVQNVVGARRKNTGPPISTVKPKPS
jgi:hypothetical protein